MSRPIKFRAWDKERREYLSGGHVLLSIPQGRGERETGVFLDLFDRRGAGYRDRFDIEQFTGLHDKNGREIWEGDVLQLDDTVSPMFRRFVEFDRGSFGYRDRVGDWVLLMHCSRDFLVIGNIHEQTELLK